MIFAVSWLTRFNTNLRNIHHKIADWIIQYFYSTKEKTLRYENENNELETHYLEVIRKFLYGYLWLTCFNVFFKNIAKWINSFFYFLFGLKNVITQIFVISNDDVTAKFLSRYMARKYQQGFGIMEIVNPLTKELKVVAESFKDTLIINAYNKFKNKNKIFINHYRGLFKNFLMIMSTAFIYEIFKFYKYRYIWLTFEFIILSIVNFNKKDY